MKQTQFIITLCFLYFIGLSAGAQNVLSFDGTNDYVDLGDNYGFDTNDPFTVEAWVRISPSNASVSQIISKLDDNTIGWGIQVMRSNHFHAGTILVYLCNPWNVSMAARFGDTNIRDDQWHRIAVTYDGSGDANGIRMWVDGVEEIYHPSANTLAGSISNNARCLIGAWDNGGGAAVTEFFNGDMDHLRIWDVVRTPAQINSFWNRSYELCSPPNASLLGLYKFNRGVAGGDNTLLRPAVIDQAWVRNHGTLVNFSRNGASSNWVGGQPIIPCAFAPAKAAETSPGITSKDFQIYPNPSQGRLQLDLPALDGNYGSLKIMDSQGKQVYSIDQLSPGTQELDLRDLRAGNYYLLLQAPTGRVQKKFSIVN